MSRPKTVSDLIVAVTALLIVAVVAAAAVIGNDHADKRHAQMLQSCVAAGHIWVRGDCLLPTQSAP